LDTGALECTNLGQPPAGLHLPSPLSAGAPNRKSGQCPRCTGSARSA